MKGNKLNVDEFECIIKIPRGSMTYKVEYIYSSMPPRRFFGHRSCEIESHTIESIHRALDIKWAFEQKASDYLCGHVCVLGQRSPVCICKPGKIV